MVDQYLSGTGYITVRNISAMYLSGGDLSGILQDVKPVFPTFRSLVESFVGTIPLEIIGDSYYQLSSSL